MNPRQIRRTANPKPIGRKRDTLEGAGYNLAAALVKRKAEATRFVTDLAIPFTNNPAESAIRLAQNSREGERMLPKLRGCEGVRHRPFLPCHRGQTRRRTTRCPRPAVPRRGLDATPNGL